MTDLSDAPAYRSLLLAAQFLNVRMRRMQQTSHKDSDRSVRTEATRLPCLCRALSCKISTTDVFVMLCYIHFGLSKAPASNGPRGSGKCRALDVAGGAHFRCHPKTHFFPHSAHVRMIHSKARCCNSLLFWQLGDGRLSVARVQWRTRRPTLLDRRHSALFSRVRSSSSLLAPLRTL